MPIPETDDDRLAFSDDWGEEFATGHATTLRGIFDRASEMTALTTLRVANGTPMLECRTADVEEHELVKQSKLTRLEDGKDYFVKDLHPDGTGMTQIVLRS